MPAHKQVKIQSCHFELPVSQNALLFYFLDNFRAYKSYSYDINIKREYRAILFYFVPDSSIFEFILLLRIYMKSLFTFISHLLSLPALINDVKDFSVCLSNGFHYFFALFDACLFVLL